MNFRSLSALAAIVCMITASCYPLPDPAIKQGTVTQPTLTPEQMKLKQEEEMRLKAEQELKNQQLANNPQLPNHTTPPVEPPKPNDYPFANKIPGREGFVFSPYNNKVVDVRDIPSGTLVQDPTYPPSEKKYFRVP